MVPYYNLISGRHQRREEEGASSVVGPQTIGQRTSSGSCHYFYQMSSVSSLSATGTESFASFGEKLVMGVIWFELKLESDFPSKEPVTRAAS